MEDHSDNGNPVILFRALREGAFIPSRAHPGDAGWDLYVSDEVEIPPFGFVDVHTGVALAPPKGHWVRVVGRSSTVRNRGLLVIEGIIDTGWRGEISFGVRNLGPEPERVHRGDRLAQAIIQKHVEVTWEITDVLPAGDRGDRGFGSTGR